MMNQAITKPLLPPRAGYVEVIDDSGNHVYAPTEETKTKLEQDALIASLTAQLAETQSTQDAMLGIDNKDEEE